MKYATVDEKSNPDKTTVPIIKGRMARLAWYSTCDFSALSLTASYVDTTRLAIDTARQPVAWVTTIFFPQHVNFVWGCCGNMISLHLISGLFTSTTTCHSPSDTSRRHPSHLSLLFFSNKQKCRRLQLSLLLLLPPRRLSKRASLFNPCIKAISANHGQRRSSKSTRSLLWMD
jgi:hypothetical protein